MWINVIMLLCIQQCILLPGAQSRARDIHKGRVKIYESQVEETSENQLLEQNDALETEEGEDDVANGSDVRREATMIYNDVDDIYDQEFHPRFYKRGNRSGKQQRVFRIRGLMPQQRVLAESDIIETDPEDEDQIEELESNSKSGQQNDMYVYDTFESPTGSKGMKNSERAKRLTINSSKERVDSSSEPLENSDDSSLNESDVEEYGEDQMTSLQPLHGDKAVFVSMTTTENSSSLPRSSKENISANTYNTFPDNIKKKQESVGRNFFRHGIKSKVNNKEKNEKIVEPRNGKTCNGNTHSDGALELNKAYSDLVCAVEKFMNYANKTIDAKVNEECVTSSQEVQMALDTSPAYSTWEPSSNNYPNTNPTAQSNKESSYAVIHFDKNFTLLNDTSQLFSEEICSTMRKSEKGESTILCEDTETEADSRLHEDEEINSILKKKQPKVSKSEYNDDSGSVYVYNDYDRVDPNEEVTEVPQKNSIAPTLIHSQRSSVEFSTTTQKERSSGLTFRISRLADNDIRTNDTTNQMSGSEVGAMASATYATKVKITQGKRFENAKGLRKITSGRKASPRRKHVPKRYSEDVTESMLNQDVTDFPLSRKLPPNQEGDTEIIEVEYL